MSRFSMSTSSNSNSFSHPNPYHKSNALVSLMTAPRSSSYQSPNSSSEPSDILAKIYDERYGEPRPIPGKWYDYDQYNFERTPEGEKEYQNDVRKYVKSEIKNFKGDQFYHRGGKRRTRKTRKSRKSIKSKRTRRR